MLPPGSSDPPEDTAGNCIVLRFGLASDGVYICPCRYRQGGSLLHCPSNLTGTKPAVHFCCTSLGVTSTGRYPASCPVKPGLSSSATFRPGSRDHLSYLPHIYQTLWQSFLYEKPYFFHTENDCYALIPGNNCRRQILAQWNCSADARC